MHGRNMEERTHLLLKASLGRLKSLHLVLILRADPLSECLQLTTCLPVLLKHGCRGGTPEVPPSSYTRGAHSPTLAPPPFLPLFPLLPPPNPFLSIFYFLFYLPSHTPLSSLPSPPSHSPTFTALPFTILGLFDTSQDAHFSKLKV